MASRADFGKSSGAGLRALIMALLAALPAGVCLLNLPPGALAACGSYGYLCTQTACLRAEIWTPQGWKGDSATIYGTQGSSIAMCERS